MPIDGLGNILGILPVKKEKEAGETSKRNQKKDRNKGDKKDGDEPKEKEGKIDIRI
jgi:hypothetical protein